MKTNSRGASLVETLVGAALLGTTIYFVTGAIKQMGKDAQKTQIGETHFQVLEKVVLEIQGKRAADLPETDHCRTRLYDKEGSFVQEDTSTFPITDAKCKDDNSFQAGYRVVISSKAATEDLLKIHFLKSDGKTQQPGMKLPKYGSPLKIIDVSVATPGRDALHFSTFKGN
jgi:hypothetical protein